MNNLVKVGFCIAYDWHMLERSLPLVYEYADAICLSIDKERKSWAGEQFTFDEVEFQRLISTIDIQEKIFLLEEDFHLPQLTPMQNEVRQRSRMAEELGKGGWHVQLDCDEYFLEFGRFAQRLRNAHFKKPINICCAWVTLYKKTEHGFLFVKPQKKEQVEFIQIATNQPSYKYGRRNQYFNHYSKYLIVHQSWARPEKEIIQKLSNWGHKNDFDGNQYLIKWKGITADNYGEFTDLHPINPPLWPKLSFQKAETIEEFNKRFQWSDFPYTNWQLAVKNSQWVSRFRRVVSLITG